MVKSSSSISKDFFHTSESTPQNSFKFFETASSTSQTLEATSEVIHLFLSFVHVDPIENSSSSSFDGGNSPWLVDDRKRIETSCDTPTEAFFKPQLLTALRLLEEATWALHPSVSATQASGSLVTYDSPWHLTMRDIIDGYFTDSSLKKHLSIVLYTLESSSSPFYPSLSFPTDSLLPFLLPSSVRTSTLALPSSPLPLPPPSFLKGYAHSKVDRLPEGRVPSIPPLPPSLSAGATLTNSPLQMPSAYTLPSLPPTTHVEATGAMSPPSSLLPFATPSPLASSSPLVSLGEAASSPQPRGEPLRKFSSVDMLPILLQCRPSLSSESTGRRLLLEALRLHVPRLAIYASCFEDVSLVACMQIWLRLQALLASRGGGMAVASCDLSSEERAMASPLTKLPKKKGLDNSTFPYKLPSLTVLLHSENFVNCRFLEAEIWLHAFVKTMKSRKSIDVSSPLFSLKECFQLSRDLLHTLIETFPLCRAILLKLLYKTQFSEEFTLYYFAYQLTTQTKLAVDFRSDPSHLLDLLLKQTLFDKAREWIKKAKDQCTLYALALHFLYAYKDSLMIEEEEEKQKQIRDISLLAILSTFKKEEEELQGKDGSTSSSSILQKFCTILYKTLDFSIQESIEDIEDRLFLALAWHSLALANSLRFYFPNRLKYEEIATLIQWIPEEKPTLLFFQEENSEIFNIGQFLF
ncbi:hypothetical protein IE077_000040 [Cardiosporidium cionae]|uniref:Uncharacterized protein n=1 Tax=Cardiosporidium cionae TaxID=476202 RepID=A0ABQ7J3W8_9APIC|nr:hypothetical protein IE077_000040 [Cardiosporidium cionae]|eukprot:KAF8817807.1 hypothetical protein IE077_000040 [Cardiosporidium cionae]